MALKLFSSRFLLGAAIISQLVVPVTMVGSRAWTLQHGERVLMHCEPVDPYDAFRGRYVALSVEGAVIDADEAMIAHLDAAPWERSAYLTLTREADGFVKPDKLTVGHPPGAGLYFKVKVRRFGGNKLRVVYPFDRYYMEEKLAPRAESLYRKHAGKRKAHVAVRIAPDGAAVLEELYIGGEPIYKALKRSASTTEP